MPRGVYDRGPKAKKSKVAKVAVKAKVAGSTNSNGLLEICENSLKRRSELCDMLDRNLEVCEDLLKQLDRETKGRQIGESMLKSATSLLRRLSKWSEGRPIDQNETELINLINGTVALLNEMDRKFDPS